MGKFMKTTFLLVLFFVLGSTSSFSQEDPRSKVKGKSQVKGGYKSCNTYTYSYKFGSVDLESKQKGKFRYTLDNIGNRIEIEDSFPYRKITCRYDDSDNLVEEVYSDTSGKMYAKNKYTFDKKGDLQLELYYNSDGKIESKTTYRYDKAGNLIEYEYSTDTYSQKYIYKNLDRTIIKELEVLSDGRKVLRTTFKYDAKGTLAETLYHNLDGTTTRFSKYKYNDKGLKIEEITKSDDNMFWSGKRTYRYDDFGNVIEEISYDKFYEPIEKTEYIYSK